MAQALLSKAPMHQPLTPYDDHRQRCHLRPRASALALIADSQLSRKRSRGVTLIEVLIVVAILSLLSAGVAAAVLHVWSENQIKITGNNALELRGAAQRWRALGHSGCPTPEVLRKDKVIDKASRLEDAWGEPFVIGCEEEECTVTSKGPDKRSGTPDDIRVPPP